MAKAAKKATPAKPPKMDVKDIKPGMELKFIGYSEEGLDPLLEEGELVVVKHTTKEVDGSHVVEVARKSDRTVTETLLLDEVQPVTDDVGAEQSAEQEPETKATTVKKKPVQNAAPAKAKPAAAKIKETKKAKGTAVATVPAKPAPTKEEETMEALVHLPSVRKILKGVSTHKELSNLARDLAAEAEGTYFTLGGVLAEILQTGAYQKAGYRLEDFGGKSDKAFGAFVQAELGFKGRKGLYLANIYRNFSKLDIDEARLAKIGWTKVRLIANHVTPDNFSALLKDAEKMTRDELDEYVKTELVEVKAGAAVKSKRTSYKFSVFADQAVNVDAALARAQEATNSDKPGDNLSYIVLDWYEQMGGQELPTKEAAIAQLEAKYGITLQEASDTKAVATMTDETVKKAAKKSGAVKPKATTKAKPAAKPKAKAKVKAKGKRAA